MIVSIGALERAASRRKPGYVEAVLAIGKRIEGDRIELNGEQWAEIARDFRLGPVDPPGLGDAIAKIAKPIAGVIDRALGTKLSSCASCEDRRRRLNRIRLG